jgi:hypothetical protein
MATRAKVRWRSEQKRGSLFDEGALPSSSLATRDGSGGASSPGGATREAKGQSGGSNGAVRRGSECIKRTTLALLVLCIWVVSLQRLVLSYIWLLDGRTGVAVQQFVRRGSDVGCVAQIAPASRTASLEEAMALCLETTGCTAVLRQVKPYHDWFTRRRRMLSVTRPHSKEVMVG